MPKRTDIRSILIIGAGPIVIGQASEFDYSGVQACKALREEGYRIVLVNSNPATIMTDPDMADATYVEPITPEFVEQIIAKERPDALLPTMGGQTALNAALALEKSGVLERYGVEMIGAKSDVIERAEDRSKFRDAMDALGLESPKSRAVYTLEEGHGRPGLRGPAGDRAAVLHPGRHRRGHRLQFEEFRQIVAGGLTPRPSARC
jgi:carbamoyl-phosphate synthase large subunit